MDCQRAREILDCVGYGTCDFPEDDVLAAEAHRSVCRECSAIVHERRQLDRKIGRMLRSVDVPEGARRELVAKLVRMQRDEPADVADDPTVAECGEAIAAATGGWSASRAAAERPRSEPVVESVALPANRPRRWVRGLVPAAICLVVAAIGFYGVVWLLTPQWTVEEVRRQLAGLDFDALQRLPEFHGDSVAATLPADAAWQSLDWCCATVPHGVSGTTTRHAFAVFGFAIHDKHHDSIRGLLAVIPRRLVGNPPTAQSFATAAPEYVPAQIGEAAAVAWTSGDVVCVCLIEGGADSLAVLHERLSAPAA